MTIPDEARCKKGIVHHFTVIGEYDDAQVERCIQCSHKEIFKKIKGKVENIKYYRFHFRDYLQPRGSMYGLYKEIYGDEHLNRIREHEYNKKEFKKHL